MRSTKTIADHGGRNHSLTEAAERIGVSRRTLYHMIAAGTLATIKLGRRRLVPPGEIERLTSATQ